MKPGLAFQNEDVIPSSRPISSVCAEESFIAFSDGSNRVFILPVRDTKDEPLCIVGHASSVLSLAACEVGETNYLCTASKDRLVIWDIEKCYASAKNGEEPKPDAWTDSVPGVRNVLFSLSGDRVVVCVAEDVYVFTRETFEFEVRLEGHIANVTCAAFLPADPSILISASEDRTFKLWDVEKRSFLYESAILSVSPFMSLTTSTDSSRFALGSADGKVRFFDIVRSEESGCVGCREVGVTDLRYHINRSRAAAALRENARKQEREVQVVRSRGAAALAKDKAALQKSQQLDKDTMGVLESESSFATLAMVWFRSPADPTSALAWKEGSEPVVAVAVALPSALCVIDCHTLQVCAVLDFRDQPCVPLGPTGSLGCTASSVAFSPQSVPLGASYPMPSADEARDGDVRKVLVLVASAFASELPVLSIYPTPWPQSHDPVDRDSVDIKPSLQAATPSKASDPVDSSDQSRAAEPGVSAGSGIGFPSDFGERHGDPTNIDGAAELSMFLQGPLPDDSPLRATFEHTPARAKTQLKKTPKGNQALVDKPVTFHARVKSSGYGTPPTRYGRGASSSGCNQGGRRRSLGGEFAAVSRPSQRRHSIGGTASVAVPLVRRSYPVDCGHPRFWQAQHDLPKKAMLHNGPIHRVLYTGDGSRVLTCASDMTARASRVPFAKYEAAGTSFLGHNGAVTSVTCSHDSQRALTASVDKSAMLWALDKGDPILKFTHTAASVSGPAAPTSTTSSNLPFSSPVVHAQFFYQDRFIFVASGRRLYMYKYIVDTSPMDDIARLQKRDTKYKSIKVFVQQGQSISTFAGINSFLSNLVLVSASNRVIQVIDVGVGKTVHTLREPHERAVHRIALFEASEYTCHPPHVHNTFLTASTDNTVKLWDLRSMTCARQFSGHTNRVHSTGIAFSPCGRFLATGSEDKAAYVFDMRTGSMLEKLAGHTDVVTDVAFHPIHPQLATACFDSRIRFFSDTQR